MNKKGISVITQTALLFLVARGVIVLLFYLILIRPYTDSIQNESIKMIANIILFIISLALVIGGGKGMMQVGKIFKFSR